VYVTPPLLPREAVASSLHERRGHIGLSSEAGFNDGLAFPFVFLGIYLTMEPAAWRSWIGHWLPVDVLYAVALELPLGWLLGHACGRLYSRLMHRDLALLLFVYGLVEMVGAYGFLGVFASGLAFRRAVECTGCPCGRSSRGCRVGAASRSERWQPPPPLSPSDSENDNARTRPASPAPVYVYAPAPAPAPVRRIVRATHRRLGGQTRRIRRISGVHSHFCRQWIGQ
jgi:hypothetical protein